MALSDRNPFSSTWVRRDADDALKPQGRLSYVAGATDEALKFMTVSQLLDRACERHGGGTAAIFAIARTTWQPRCFRSA